MIRKQEYFSHTFLQKIWNTALLLAQKKVKTLFFEEKAKTNKVKLKKLFFEEKTKTNKVELNKKPMYLI